MFPTIDKRETGINLRRIMDRCGVSAKEVQQYLGLGCVQSVYRWLDGISQKVYFIRGQQVMLDTDLAEIYGYEVKRLNEQVKRNMERFPEDFMFQLIKEEIPEEFSKSQFATLKILQDGRGLNIKKLPYAFTEQGIYMLATVLRGPVAEQQRWFCSQKMGMEQKAF